MSTGVFVILLVFLLIYVIPLCYILLRHEESDLDG
jgi:hypothetical protein